MSYFSFCLQNDAFIVVCFHVIFMNYRKILLNHFYIISYAVITMPITCAVYFVYFKGITAKNTIFSPNFLLWKFCGKTQFRPKLCGNRAFSQNFHTMKLGEITIFFAVKLSSEKILNNKCPNARRGIYWCRADFFSYSK